MKILMLNTFDQLGGAARAAGRLQKGVRALGVEASMLVQFKSGNGEGVICTRNPLRKAARRLKVYLGLLPVRRYPNKPENNFSPSLLPDRVTADVARLNPDVIHLHWLCAGFMQVETLSRLAALGKPLVWTLHDSWAFTGGCHVPFDCTRYGDDCGACPVLGSTDEVDLSRRTWNRKHKAMRNMELAVVTPSRWLADCAKGSSLLKTYRVEVIPNGLDTEMFQAREKQRCREKFGLPLEKKVVLFGAVGGGEDRNKGFHLLMRALQDLGKNSSEMMALLFGAWDPGVETALGMPAVRLGTIRDDCTLADVYSAADVLVLPSVLENLPNTVMEAMACGTPCVSFLQGGVPDLVDHWENGYLAQPYDPEDLGYGISWILGDRERRARLSAAARRKVEVGFGLERIASRYISLYREVARLPRPERALAEDAAR